MKSNHESKRKWEKIGIWNSETGTDTGTETGTAVQPIKKIRNDRPQELFPEHQQFSSCNLYIPDEFVINETSRKEDFTLLK